MTERWPYSPILLLSTDVSGRNMPQGSCIYITCLTQGGLGVLRGWMCPEHSPCVSVALCALPSRLSGQLYCLPRGSRRGNVSEYSKAPHVSRMTAGQSWRAWSTVTVSSRRLQNRCVGGRLNQGDPRRTSPPATASPWWRARREPWWPTSAPLTGG